MSVRLHDDEPDTGPEVVRQLLRDQCPNLAGLPLEPLSNTGTDNALYRLGESLVARLPRIPGAARSLASEIDWLPRLQSQLSVGTPELVHAGEPGADYPYPWAVLSWLSGADAWATRDHDGWFGADLARDLATAVLELRAVPVGDAPRREPGSRGGPLAALDERVHWWLDGAHGFVDVAAVTRLWDQCLEADVDAGHPVLLHGDLIPGNLLVDRGRLTAVIDWGGIGAGDPAQDLDPAWSVLDRSGAATFRDALAVDSQTWLRARGFALEHAIGAVIYYTPRRHPLADVMRRSLDRLLAET
ncbi:MAG TPA: aminoglycoside phosphotransferase family protein [Propionibacteriaceae bacterium]